MMLPILISVSLAPGSYFFCAIAAVAASNAATAIVAPTTRVAGFRMVLSLAPRFADNCRSPGTVDQVPDIFCLMEQKSALVHPRTDVLSLPGLKLANPRRGS